MKVKIVNMMDRKILIIGVGAIGSMVAKTLAKGGCRHIDIVDYDVKEPSSFVLAFDVLEHLNYKDLDKAINNLVKSTNKHILISVPVLGDPNLEADPTHIIKEDKEWWIKQFTDKRLKLIPTPEHFQFKEQIMIFEMEDKKDGK